MKKIIIGFLLITIFLNIIVNSTVHASLTYTLASKTDSSISEVISGGDKFINAASKNIVIDEAELKKASDSVFNMLSVLGVAIAVIIGSILAIKFMVASVEEKAQIKQYLIPYIVGCVVIFGAFRIWKIIVDILEQV